MKKSKSLFSCLLTFALIVSIFKFNTFSVSATPASTTKATIGSLDLNSMSSVDKLDTEGYKWEAETKTLTLDGINIEVTEDLPGLIFDDDLNIVLTKDSVNKITVTGLDIAAALVNINPDPDVISKLTLSGEGSLDISGPTSIDCESLEVKSGNYTFTSNSEEYTTVIFAEYFNMSGGIVNLNCEIDDAIGLMCYQLTVSGGELNISLPGGESTGIYQGGLVNWGMHELGQIYSVSGGKISIEMAGGDCTGIDCFTNFDISGGDISIISDSVGLSCYTFNMTGGHFISTSLDEESLWYYALSSYAGDYYADYTEYKKYMNLGDKIEIKQGGQICAYQRTEDDSENILLYFVSFTNLAKEYLNWSYDDITEMPRVVELGEKKTVPTPEPEVKPVDNVKPGKTDPSTNPNTNVVGYEVILLLLSGLLLGALILKKKACR